MRLGFISDLSEQDFAFAQQENLEVLEHNINAPEIDAFIDRERSRELRQLMEKYGRKITAIGRFGRERISDDREVREKNRPMPSVLSTSAAMMEVPTFVCGAGKGRSSPSRRSASEPLMSLASL